MRLIFMLIVLNFVGFNKGICQSDSIYLRLSSGIVGRMVEKMMITQRQCSSIDSINLLLYKQKESARKTLPIGTSRIQLQNALQKIENSRDSLYGIILVDRVLSVYKENKGYILSGKN